MFDDLKCVKHNVRWERQSIVYLQLEFIKGKKHENMETVTSK